MNETLVAYLAELIGTGTAELSLALRGDSAEASEQVQQRLQDLQVHSAEQWQQLLAAEHDRGHREGLKEGTGNSYGAVDKYLERLTGHTKESDERTLDYLQRSLKDLPTRSEWNDNQQKLLQLQAALDQTTERHRQEQQAQAKAYTLDQALLKVPVAGEAKSQESQRQYLRFLFAENYELLPTDGGWQVASKEGHVVMDPAQGQPLPPEQVMQQLAQEHLAVAPTVRKRGTGVEYASSTGTSSHQGFATLADYKQHLSAQGIVLASPEGQQAIAQWLRDHSH